MNKILTEEEKKEICTRYIDGFNFVYHRDLSGTVVVIPDFNYNKSMLMTATAKFTANFIHFTLHSLNGFPGLDTVNWEIKDEINGVHCVL